MTERHSALLSRLMDRFARQHWNDGFAPGRAHLTIEGSRLRCAKDGETIEGDAAAPLLFVTGAWGLIFARECDGRFGHRVDGRINRVWPNGVGRPIVEHRMDAEVQEWAAAWPGLLFSASLYPGTGSHRRPHSLDDAPMSTTVSGIAKRALRTAGDDDPRERLRVAEFVEALLRREWSSTAEDRMMAAVGEPLRRLADDTEPAIREVALLALETCAARCWNNRAYGLYETLCRRLIDAGLNGHLQFVRLAESAYACGDMAEGDRLWAIGSAGQNPLRAVAVGSGHDMVGDWRDLHVRILRQAGGTHVGRSRGIDPNPGRQAKLERTGIVPPEPAVAARHREAGRTLLARAAEGAEARLAVDLPAARAGKAVPLGPGEIGPHERRLFLHEIYQVQALIAEDDGDTQAELRLLFRAQAILWSLRGRERRDWRWGNEDELAERAAGYDDAALAALGMPGYLRPIVAEARRHAALAASDGDAEPLFWLRFLRAVRTDFLRSHHATRTPVAAEDVEAGFRVTRYGGELEIAHAALDRPVRGPLRAPLLTAMRAWYAALVAVRGTGAWVETEPGYALSLDAADIRQLATIADERFAAGAAEDAVALYRIAAGIDPLMIPWQDGKAVTPLSLDAIPPDLRDAVTRRSPLEADGGHARLKPKGRRIEQLARDYDAADIATRRHIGHWLREACAAGDSEIVRVLKVGQPLLVRMWDDGEPQVREAAILAACTLLVAQRLYLPNEDAGPLRRILSDAAVANLDTRAGRPR